MEILGIGPLELFFILIIALIVIGPKDMVKSGRTIGKWLRKIVTSPQWQTITRTSRELRNIPNRLIREAGLEDMQQELNSLKQTTSEIQNILRETTILPPGWNNPFQISPNPSPAKPPEKEVQTTDPPILVSTPENLDLDGEIEKPSPVYSLADFQVTDPQNNLPFASWTIPPWEAEPDGADDGSERKVDLAAWITPPARYHYESGR